MVLTPKGGLRNKVVGGWSRLVVSVSKLGVGSPCGNVRGNFSMYFSIGSGATTNAGARTETRAAKSFGVAPETFGALLGVEGEKCTRLVSSAASLTASIGTNTCEDRLYALVEVAQPWDEEALVELLAALEHLLSLSSPGPLLGRAPAAQLQIPEFDPPLLGR